MLYAIVGVLSGSVFFAVYGVMSAVEDLHRTLRNLRRRRAAR